MAKQNKSEYWQVVRGICILAVVMIRCPTGQAFSTADTCTCLILRQCINFPVALFIFMAGYFVNTGKIINNTRIYILDQGGATPAPPMWYRPVFICCFYMALIYIQVRCQNFTRHSSRHGLVFIFSVWTVGLVDIPQWRSHPIS